jgi:hypothetical protein
MGPSIYMRYRLSLCRCGWQYSARQDHRCRPYSRRSHGDTPQVPYPCVDWSRPKLSDAYRSSYTECQRDDSSHTQSQWQSTLHSYTSHRSNAWRSRSVLPIIVSTLVPYTTTYLWLSLRSFPIPWPCSLPFHCKSSFYILFNTAYFCSLTIALLICCPVVISRALASVLPIT